MLPVIPDVVHEVALLASKGRHKLDAGYFMG